MGLSLKISIPGKLVDFLYNWEAVAPVHKLSANTVNHNIMENLPMEITEDILRRLPIEAALPAKQVCKTFRNLLRSKTDKVGLLFAESYNFEEKNRLYYGDEYDPILGKMNYNYSCYDRLDKMRDGKFLLDHSYIGNMFGSCNGLVCFGGIRYPDLAKPFVVCNPVTGEAVYIPEHKDAGKNRFPMSGFGYCYGFGYCHSKNEYKIVSMQHQEYNGKSRVFIYTVGGSTGWRSKGSISIYSMPMGSVGIYVNGALHWLDGLDRIVAFDLDEEKFQFIPLSRFRDVKYKHRPKLLGGNHLYLVYTFDDYKHRTDIWAYKRKNTNTSKNCAMKANYNDKNSWHWIMEFSIELEIFFFEPMAVTMNDELILTTYNTLFIYENIKTSNQTTTTLL